MSSIKLHSVHKPSQTIDVLVDVQFQKFFTAQLRLNGKLDIVNTNCGYITNRMATIKPSCKQVKLKARIPKDCAIIDCTISYLDDQNRLLHYENVQCPVNLDFSVEPDSPDIVKFKTTGLDQAARQSFLNDNLNKRLSRWKFLINRINEELHVNVLSKGTTKSVCCLGPARGNLVHSSDYFFTIYPYVDKFIVPAEIVSKLSNTDGTQKLACFELVRSDFNKEDVIFKSLISNFIEV